MTFFEKLRKMPPILVRILARHKGGRPLTDEEISQGSLVDGGRLTAYEVAVLSQEVSWDEVDIITLKRFCAGCRFNMENWGTVSNYLANKPSWKYLRSSRQWTSFYAPLIRRWMTHYGRD